MPGKKKSPAIGKRLPREHFIVVSYDIANDRRRQKVVKIMEGYGVRKQYSVFECRLTVRNFQRLRDKLAEVIDRKEDSVLFYPLCQSCRRQRDGLGRGRPTYEREHEVI